MDTQRVRNGWIDFVRRNNFTDFLTLNFNRRATPMMGRTQLGHFLQRLDRYLIGPRYAKHVGRRTFGLAFPEHVTSNFHFHCPLKFNHPSPMANPSFKDLVSLFWKQEVPSGTTDIRPIYDSAGLARYISKELLKLERFQNVILFSEFWPEGDYPEHDTVDWRSAGKLVRAGRR